LTGFTREKTRGGHAGWCQGLYARGKFWGPLQKNIKTASYVIFLFRKVAGKRPVKGLVHHSDRGSQYCATDYGEMLKQFGMKASMSGKGNCYDNAPMESFLGHNRE